MPLLFFGNPFEGIRDDPNLSWLHIEVCIPRRYFWQNDTFYNARIYAVSDDGEEAQLFWRGDMGPLPEMNLLYGDPPRHVPVVIRLGCTGDRWLSIDPTRFQEFHVSRFETLLTTMDTAMRRSSRRVNFDTGVHKLKFRIRSGGEHFDSNLFNLIVPGDGIDNSGFKIHVTR